MYIATYIKICLIILQIKRGITKTNFRTIDKGYADCMILSWGLIWKKKICNDSKILNSQMLLFVPIIEKWSRLIWLLLQEMAWSWLWNWEGWDKGSPVLTLTPACSAALVDRFLMVEPTYWAPHLGLWYKLYKLLPSA